MRRLLVAALALCACLLCHGALAEESFEVDGIFYTASGGYAIVTGFDPRAQTITYPETARGLPVRLQISAGNVYQWERPEMTTTLIVAEGVRTIPRYAFTGWPSLKKVVLPSTLETIEADALSQLPLLQDITLPEGLRTIGERALFWCEALERITIPASVTDIQPYALSSDTAFPSRLSLVLADGSASFRMENGVLYTLDGSELVMVPIAFEGPLTLPDTVRTLRVGALHAAQRVTELTLPEGIERLRSTDIQALFALERLVLPASLREIDQDTLSYSIDSLRSLQQIEVAPENPTFYSEEGLLFARAEKELLYVPPGRQFVSVPQGTLSVSFHAFHDRPWLTGVTLPAGIRTLPQSAFGGATALRRVTLPLTLETIGDYAFHNCIALESLALPPGLLEIGENAFQNCVTLASITLPDSLREVSYTAFSGTSPSFVIYSRENTAGQTAARIGGHLWAEPGGIPAGVKETRNRTTPAAVVANGDRADRLHLRAEPSTSARSLGLYDNGTTVLILGEENGWARVRLGDLEGYMLASALFRTDPFTDTVRILWCRGRDFRKPLPVYAQPVWDAAVSLDVSGSAVFTVTDQLGTWLEIQTEAGHGYVAIQDVAMSWEGGATSTSDRPTMAVVSNPDPRDRLHLRAQPETSGESLGRYFNGTQVEILAHREDGWYKVRLRDTEGYMRGEFLWVLYAGPETLENEPYGDG